MYTQTGLHWVELESPTQTETLGSLSNNDGDDYEKDTLTKSEVALIQTLSRLFHLVQFVKCWQLFLELNSKRLQRSSGEEK